MLLSPHFTLAEMTATAVRDVANTPSLDEAANLKFLCEHLLEPLRARFGPLYTTSGYRSPAVNARIGGSSSSMHVHGCAWDGIPLRDGVRWADMITFLLSGTLPVDQVIYEFGRWLHVGTRPNGLSCRGQALMIFESGRYEAWNPQDPRITR